MADVMGAATPAQAVSAGLAQMREALDVLGGVDLHQLDGEALLGALDAVEQVRRRTDAVAARVLATVESDGRWAVDGARSMAAWYRARTGRHRAGAAREVRQARALRDHLPGTARALAAGEISSDHVAAIVRHTTGTEARRERLRDRHAGEHLLLTHARGLDASAFDLAVRHWSLRADPEAADRAYVEDGAREEFYLAETTDGYVPGGWLSKASGQVVLTALAARTGTPAKGDGRSPGQRRARALVGLAQLALDSGALRPGARIRPHLSVHVPLETLQRLVAASKPARRHPGCPLGVERPGGAGHQADRPGAAFGLPGPDEQTRPTTTAGATGRATAATAAAATTAAASAAGAAQAGAAGGEGWCGCGQELPEAVIGADLDAAAMGEVAPATFEDGTPLAPALLARIACTGAMHRVVFGPDSEVLDVGREKRIFTAAQTRAIIARDRHCQYPDCDAPPGEGEIHHSIWWWEQLGSTSVRLGVLLCWAHHDHVHQHRIGIERRKRRWVFLRRDGSEIEATTRRAPGA
ncbi:HNH endonuclease signature motif containing protein [Georgenia daeguensis]|uniref:HNH endonuclease signature motif containing protein n=1 Tax=Georgenia daeguensis TaxID=908355 RepID=UPI0031EE2786